MPSEEEFLTPVTLVSPYKELILRLETIFQDDPLEPISSRKLINDYLIVILETKNFLTDPKTISIRQYLDWLTLQSKLPKDIYDKIGSICKVQKTIQSSLKYIEKRLRNFLPFESNSSLRDVFTAIRLCSIIIAENDWFLRDQRVYLLAIQTASETIKEYCPESYNPQKTFKLKNTDEPKPTVFISHASDDKLFARRLSRDLISSGAHIWLDEEQLNVGDHLLTSLQDAIGQSLYLVVILSPPSMDSQWVKKEIELALASKGSKKEIEILPIVYKDCIIHPGLSEIISIDMSTETKYSNGLNRLIRKLGLTEYDRIETKNIPVTITCMFQDGVSSIDDIIAAVENLGYSHISARDWVSRIFKTIAHGNF